MKKTDIEKLKDCLHEIGCFFEESTTPLGRAAITILGASRENAKYAEVSSMEFDENGKFVDIDLFG